jgi:NAD(P)-dependent dehydrogenase (short-subunit alcohol dehydrogenase family)
MVGKPNEVLYSAAKGGLIMLAKGAAIEWAPRDIRVNVVAPGLTATPIIEASIQRNHDPEAYRRERESRVRPVSTAPLTALLRGRTLCAGLPTGR